MRRAILVLLGGLVGGALAPHAAWAVAEAHRLIQAGFSGSMGTSDLTFGSDPADAGDIRLENNTSICWEASPTGTDRCASVDASEILTLSPNTPIAAASGDLFLVSLVSMGDTAADVAESGTLKFQNGALLGWEASPSGADVTFGANSSEALAANAPITSSANDMAWSVVAGANTACTTTCTFACVMGWDSGSSNLPVNCASAAADNCLCAGAN